MIIILITTVNIGILVLNYHYYKKNIQAINDLDLMWQRGLNDEVYPLDTEPEDWK